MATEINPENSPKVREEVPTEERILAVLRHLGVSNAHFAGRAAADWTGLARAHPEVITFLAMICPLGFEPSVLASLAPRLLVFRGDQGAPDETVKRNLADLPAAMIVTISGYHSPNTYADVAVDRGRRHRLRPAGIPKQR